MTPNQEEKLIEVFLDFNQFAETFLKIRDKAGDVVPFIPNRGQRFLHEKLQKQFKERKFVRAIILKGRQGGYSTYTQGRFFWRISTARGLKAFILTHLAEATKNLFNITKLFCEKMESGVFPKPDTFSSKELRFDSLDSSYVVATAGSKGAGRSQTIQLFHGSEVAFWDNADEHAKGVMQAVSNKPGTEIILESTANGIGNYFYRMWKSAVKGESDFIPIFIPWYWQDEYACDPWPHEDKRLTDYENTLLSLYANDGLTVRHLYWRRHKIAEMGTDIDEAEADFKQEYPFNAEEAFKKALSDAFIDVKYVERAMGNIVDSQSPLVIGADIAHKGKDSTAFIRRRGRKVYGLEFYKGLDDMQIVAKIAEIIETEKPAKVMMDIIGSTGIYDRLKERGYNCVEPVNVAKSATNKEQYLNLRAELYDKLKQFLQQDIPVELPKNEALMGHLTCFTAHRNSSSRLVIQSKDEIRANGFDSPDSADALMLTFYLGEFLQSANYVPNKLPNHTRSMLT